MQFDDALRYLLGLGHETTTIKLGLANTEALLDALGRPQDSFPSVQIAGTNGKGSVAAMLDATARAAGIRTGLYTSPHLVSITERIRLAGREISREDFARAVARVRAAGVEVERATGAMPTFFEQTTAAALVAFRDERIELAILETGLGGRLDATTVARARTVAITPIALDHQEYLGSTLEEIAAEKAAIIRPGVVAVVASQFPEAEAVIRRRAAECGVAPRVATRDIHIEGTEAGGRLRVSFKTSRDTYPDITLALRGRHQTTNAAVAIELAEALREQGFDISRDAVVGGLEHAEHPGRLEMLTPTGAPPLLLDGAHNPAGAHALRAYLDEFVRAPLTMIFGAMRDKEIDEIGATLFPVARRLILTRPDNPRAAAPESLMRCAVPFAADSSTITLAPTARDALRVARIQTPPGGLICVTGSLYLIGEVKSILGDSES